MSKPRKTPPKMSANADRVRTRLTEAAQEAGISLSKLSRQLGKQPGYLRDFIRKHSPRRLDAEDREKIASILGIDPADLQDTVHLVQPSGNATRSQLTGVNQGWKDGRPGQPVITQINDLPILGRVKGGENAFFIGNGEIGGYTMRPAILLGVDEAYAVEIFDVSMVPAFKPRTHAWVHPHKPAHPGDDVVVQLRDGQALIKTLKRRIETHLILEQYNPPKEIRVPLDGVQAVHVIVGSTR